MKSAEELEQDVRRLIHAGRVRNAAEACDHLNQQYPEFESGWYTASHLAMVINEPVLAVRAIEHALQLSPGKPEWLMQHMECLGAMGNLDAARATARSMSGHLFDSAAVSAAFAGSLSRIGLFADAQRHFKHATELEPGVGQYFFNLATVEQFLGNTGAARAAVNQCLALCPDDAGAHLFRAQLQTQTLAANNVAALRTAYSHTVSEPQRRGTLCYALAKELEDIGEFEASFEYLSEGAAIKRAALHYEPQGDLDVMLKIRETYTAELFDGRIEGHINAEPIFVLGLPRTGAGLVQRILGGHSVVHPAGELTTFSVQLARHCQLRAGAAVARTVDRVPLSAKLDFVTLGEDYIAATRPATGRTAHFVDSLPLNFLYAGIIHLALPKAKIILLERDPMDTCYALYKNPIEATCPYSFDLTELANYVAAYRQLMQHWQSVLPHVLHVVHYEELISDPTPVVEKLFEYCGLSWEDACIDVHENVYAPTAESAVQSRQQVFQSSVGKWRNVEQQLKHVLQILGEPA